MMDYFEKEIPADIKENGNFHPQLNKGFL